MVAAIAWFVIGGIVGAFNSLAFYLGERKSINVNGRSGQYWTLVRNAVAFVSVVPIYIVVKVVLL